MDTQDYPDAFYLGLEETPDDAATLNVLADWYEESGDASAASCLRWSARRGYAPFTYHRENSPLTKESDLFEEGWCWWVVENYRGSNWGEPDGCRLPRELWERLRHRFDYSPSVFKDYPSRRDAYEALFAAWRIFAPSGRAPREKERRR